MEGPTYVFAIEIHENWRARAPQVPFAATFLNVVVMREILLNKVTVTEVAGVALFEEIKGNGFERMIYWALVSC